MNADETTFYLICGLMMVAGFIIAGCSAIVGRLFGHSDVAGFLLVLGVCCVLMGPLMALMGPS